MRSLHCLLLASLGLAAAVSLAAQEEIRPPKAVPVPEDEPARPAESAPAAGAKTAPKAEVVPEDDPPAVIPAGDEPWEGDEEAVKAKAKQKAEEERKAKEKADMEKREREKPVEEEVKTVKAVPNGPRPTAPPPREVKVEKPKIPILDHTDPNAKPLSLRVPGPRGLIVDRNGQPLAQNKIAHYIGVQLPMKEGQTNVQVLDFARTRLAFCQAQLPEKWDVPDSDIIQHYQKRRWVPIYCSSLLPEERVAKLKDHMPDGIVLLPIFLRTYPGDTLAGHLMGQMGKSGTFPSAKQDLEAEELMWPPTVGRAGLEKRFDKELTGEPGLYNALFDAKGEMLSEEWTARPRAGNTVVTTLDLEMQKIAERNLKERNVRGAFIILDVKTGDILAMASTPAPNPNDWVYSVSDEFYQKQKNDPENIMLCRAFQGLYPPASTFKVMTALAALESDEVDPATEFHCYKGMYFNNVYMKNHSGHDEGPMDVERAIMRSCNTWFFQAARACGGAALSSMAIRFGYGEKTGICLDYEYGGLMPTPEYYSSKKPRGSMTSGVLANTSIGQGDVLATPLQVAQMMAGVARGDAVPRPRLVKMIQDMDGRILQHFPPSTRAPLNLSRENLEAVRRGMRQVVAGDGGTGSRAENQYVAIAGKTGTGQWKPKKHQNIAWFGGFIPYKEPEYAYVCLYEGDPNEDEISGGRKVAPIVGDVFNEIYKAKKKRGEIKGGPTDDDGAGDEDGMVTTHERTRRTAPAAEVRPVAPPPPEPPPKRGGLRWLFGRRNRTAPPPAVAPAPPPNAGRPLR